MKHVPSVCNKTAAALSALPIAPGTSVLTLSQSSERRCDAHLAALNKACTHLQ